MSRFIFKQTNDGENHLYLDTPSNEGFIKVGQAEVISFTKDHSDKYIVLSKKDSLSKTLFGIIDEEVFQVTLPKTSRISIIDDVCVFERDSVWFSMVHNNGTFEEIELGVRQEYFVSYPENAKYNTLKWIYFLKEVDGYVKVSHIVDQKLVILGQYQSISIDSRSRMLCMNPDGFYDVFTPNSTNPEQGIPFNAFQSSQSVFLWDHEHKHWKSHPGTLLGKNAMYEIKKHGELDMIKLYHIHCGQADFVESGLNWEFTEKHDGLRIEDKIYQFDYVSDLLDFHNPKLTFKGKLKKLLKLK